MTTHDTTTYGHTHTDTTTRPHTEHAQAQYGRRDGRTGAHRDFLGLLERQTDAGWTSQWLTKQANTARAGERIEWLDDEILNERVCRKGEAYIRAYEWAYRRTMYFLFASMELWD
jgi:hypothetical protein